MLESLKVILRETANDWRTLSNGAMIPDSGWIVHTDFCMERRSQGTQSRRKLFSSDHQFSEVPTWGDGAHTLLPMQKGIMVVRRFGKGVRSIHRPHGHIQDHHSAQLHVTWMAPTQHRSLKWQGEEDLLGFRNVSALEYSSTTELTSSWDEADERQARYFQMLFSAMKKINSQLARNKAGIWDQGS